MSKKIYEEYCTGCGLCNSAYGKNLLKSKDGFNNIHIGKDKELIEFCRKTCPASGLHLSKEKSLTWGHYKAVLKGYAVDEEVRFKAASGGVTTATAIFLLEEGYVDGIIQVGADPQNAFKTKVFCNRTKKDVLECSASRYIDSSPLEDIVKYLSDGNKYVFIGRPCDIISLYNFLEWNPRYKDTIYCTLTFFCAGSPSKNASAELVNYFGVSEDECKFIRYRGNGWPGKATVWDKKGKIYTMEYIESWNKILGRDVRKICKLCTDGIGEMADISSGDLWNMGEDGNLSFAESQGMNVTFARTSLGKEILQEARRKGYLVLEDFQEKIYTLEKIQPYHAIRRKTLYSKILAMKMFGKTTPKYSEDILKYYSTEQNVKQNIRTFLGTVKRILQGRI